MNAKVGSPPSERLSVKTKLGFGVCDLGGNLFFTAMGFWSLYYLTDVVGLSAAAAGFAVMIGKLWDAVTDPVMGFISDRTTTRWGRRRPYLLFGAVPLFLAMWFFFTNPKIENPVLLTVWAALALCFLNTAYTVVNIPYSSLTPELTTDYHERSSLNGYRFGFAVFGTMFGAAAVLPFADMFSTRSLGFSMVGAFMGLLMMVTALITFASVRERNRGDESPQKDGFFATFMVVFKNTHYVKVLLTYALNLTALNFIQNILAYYFKYLYRDESKTSIAMGLLLLVAMICIPISVLVSKRIGKKRTYQFALLVLTISCMTIFFLGHVLGPTFFLAMMLFAGVGLGFGYVAPFAMVPDAVEYEAVTSGRRREGAYYGMWTFTSKIGTSLAVALSGFILDLAKYIEPDAATALPVQPESTLFAIRLLIGPIPACVFIAAILLIETYKLDEKAYKEVLDRSRGP